MLVRIIDFSIRQRWLVLVATALIATLGAYNYQDLPIDAVPDITNVQVQINTEAPGLLAARVGAACDVLDRDRHGRSTSPGLHPVPLEVRSFPGHRDF